MLTRYCALLRGGGSLAVHTCRPTELAGGYEEYVMCCAYSLGKLCTLRRLALCGWLHNGASSAHMSGAGRVGAACTLRGNTEHIGV